MRRNMHFATALPDILTFALIELIFVRYNKTLYSWANSIRFEKESKSFSKIIDFFGTWFEMKVSNYAWKSVYDENFLKHRKRTFVNSTATITSIENLFMQTNPIFESFWCCRASVDSTQRQYNCYLWVCPRSLITCLHDLFDDFERKSMQHSTS